jgi:anti-sigma B factor antagonist
MTRSESAPIVRGPATTAPAPHKDRLVVWVRGEQDISTAAALSATLAAAVARDRGDLVVDLGGVRFMDASTIGVLVGARRHLRLLSRSLTVRSPSALARRLFGLCGLADLIDPDPVEVASVAALGTWVAVPAVDRVDRPADAGPPGPTGLGAGSVRALSLLQPT